MKSHNIEISEKLFVEQLKDIVSASRKLAWSAINIAQVKQNWLIGQRLVEQEQHGQTRATYGARVIELASKALTEEFGRGFSPRSLWKFKQFYLEFKDLKILPTSSAESVGGNTADTIGILLCTETDKTIAHYSVLNENKQIFASKYMPYLPTEKELMVVIHVKE